MHLNLKKVLYVIIPLLIIALIVFRLKSNKTETDKKVYQFYKDQPIPVSYTHLDVYKRQLQKCVDTAQVHNRSLQMASNSILIGAEKQKEATANLIPKLSVNADYKYFTDLPTQLMPLSTFNAAAPVGKFKEAQFGVPHNLNANVQLSMPLYLSLIHI